MCLITFAWNAHPDYRLIVGANRDEWHDRPAAPATWWHDHPQILAGRDLKAGGTWMGVARSGRFAAVTNFRDPSDKKSTARSRGELVSGFLLADESPEAFLSAIKPDAHDYNGFNLIVGDSASLAYFSSRTGLIMILEPGVYALSNHTLNEPWPKVKQAKSALDAILQAKMPEEARQMAIYAILSDNTVAPDMTLPDTGVGIEWERVLSPILITTPQYGTRTSTILSMTDGGAMSFVEHTRTPDGAVSHVAKFDFALCPP
jgi:uncharacterized protein with NRDE domain